MKNFNLNFCKKLFLSISSILLLVFLIIHLIGNIGIFLGKESFNKYAELLQSNKIILWTLRISLIFSFTMHVILAIYISIKNQLSKPVSYIEIESHNSSFSSRTMLITGICVLAFIIFHIMHLTLGYIDSSLNILFEEKNKNVYEIVINAFKKKYILLIYIVSLAAIFNHIKHGFFSFQQTLGFSKIKKFEKLNSIFSIIIIIAYILIPISIALNWIK